MMRPRRSLRATTAAASAVFLLLACAEAQRSESSSATPTRIITVPGPIVPGSHRVLNLNECAPKSSDYPPESLKANEEGIATIEFEINEQGVMTESKIVKSSRYQRLDDISLRMLARCKFSPAAATKKFQIDYSWKLPK